MVNNNAIIINYSNEKLRILFEEYITQQRKEFLSRDLLLYHVLGNGRWQDGKWR